MSDEHETTTHIERNRLVVTCERCDYRMVIDRANHRVKTTDQGDEGVQHSGVSVDAPPEWLE